MQRKGSSVEQITEMHKQAGLRTPITELRRKHGVSDQSFYRWRKIYGCMLPSEAREVKQLREENVKRKRLVADLSLYQVMHQEKKTTAYIGSSGLLCHAVTSPSPRQ